VCDSGLNDEVSITKYSLKTEHTINLYKLHWCHSALV